jgi:hypothetical protein
MMEEVYAGPFSSTNDTWTRWAESFGTQLVQSTVRVLRKKIAISSLAVRLSNKNWNE